MSRQARHPEAAYRLKTVIAKSRANPEIEALRNGSAALAIRAISSFGKRIVIVVNMEGPVSGTTVAPS